MGALTNLLTGVNLGGVKGTEGVKAQPKAKDGEAFAGVLERTENNTAKTAKREESKREKVKAEKPEAAQTTDNPQPVKQKEAPNTEKATKPAEAAAVPKDEVNKKLLSALSEALGVPEDVISQILAQLNMQALDLYKPENLNLFMQKVTGVESKEQLLNVPDIQTVFKKINTALDGFATDAKAILEAQAEAALPVQIAPKSVTETKSVTSKELTDIAATDESTEAFAVKPTEQKAEQAVKPTSSDAKPQNELTQDGATREQVRMVQEFNPAAVPLQQVEQADVRTEATRNIDTQGVIDQIVDKMKVEVKGDMSEIKIQLKPEHLGDVSLKITTQNGIVTAQFVAENQRIREIIEASFNQLRDSLAQQGIQLSQLSVSVGNEQNEQQALYERERGMSGRRVETIAAGIAAEEADLSLDSEGETLTDANVNYLA